MSSLQCLEQSCSMSVFLGSSNQFRLKECDAVIIRCYRMVLLSLPSTLLEEDNTHTHKQTNNASTSFLCYCKASTLPVSLLHNLHGKSDSTGCRECRGGRGVIYFLFVTTITTTTMKQLFKCVPAIVCENLSVNSASSIKDKKWKKRFIQNFLFKLVTNEANIVQRSIHVSIL